MALDVVDPPRATYRAVFAVREVRVLIGTLLLRALSTTAEILGLSVLVYATTGSAALSAIAYGIGFAPQVLGGAFLTALADRLPARPTIVTLLLVRALPGALIGALHLPVAGMFALVAVVGCLDPVASAATGATLRSLLAGDEYVLGRSVMSAVASAAQIVGLAIGGVVLAVLSARQLLLIAAGALVVGAVVAQAGLARHGAPAASSSASSGAGRGTVRRTMAGNRAMLADRSIRGLLLAQWLPAWFVTGAESLIVSYVGETGRPAGTVGALLVSVPIGMLVGDIVVGRFVRPAARERLSLPLTAAMGVPLVAFAATLPVPLAAALLLLTGSGFGYQIGLQRRFAQALPDGAAGQGFGLLSSGLMGGQGLGPVAAGGLAALAGPGVAIATAGLAIVISAYALRRVLAG